MPRKCARLYLASQAQRQARTKTPGSLFYNKGNKKSLNLKLMR